MLDRLFLVLISFLGLVWSSGASTFAYQPLQSHSVAVGTQLILLIPLLIGLFIKIPILAYHSIFRGVKICGKQLSAT